MIIIYILAAIGGLFVVGTAGLVILLICRQGSQNEWAEPVCILTNEPCPNTDASTSTCEGCKIAEEFIGKPQEGAECK